MPKAKKKAEPEASGVPDDDQSVIRIPSKPASKPEQNLVLPSTVSPPVALFPLFNIQEVNNTYNTTTPTEEEDTSTEEQATPALNETPFIDHSIDLSTILPPEISNIAHEWKRPSDLSYWKQNENELCVVDLNVPLTPEEIQAAQDIQTKHEEAVKTAEEAGEEPPTPPEPIVKPLPREILRPVTGNNSYSNRFVSCFNLINAVTQSYLAKKEANKPPPPTPEELALQAEAEEAARIAAEEAAAAAKKSKKGKKGDVQEEVPEEVAAPLDPNHPMQENQFLWECIYPKGPDGVVPRYQSNGRYSIKMFVNGEWRRIEVDDRIPINTTTNEPLLPMSSNKGELWPLLLSKALCIVSRGRWSEFDCLSWLSSITVWQIGDWLKGKKKKEF